MRYIDLHVTLLLLVGTVLVGCNKPAETIQDSIETTGVSFANTKCPIMGGKPSEELTAEYAGKTIGFCCDGCPEKWAALSDAEKAEKFAKVEAYPAHDHADGEGHSEHDPSDRSE